MKFGLPRKISPVFPPCILWPTLLTRTVQKFERTRATKRIICWVNTVLFRPLKEDVTIVPVGGADKIATFISLMRGNELSTVCLLDTFTDQSAQARLKRMVEQKIIADKKILFYHTVIGQAYADIEDLFNKDEYLALYNGAFGKSVQLSDLSLDQPIMTQLKRLNGNKAFNHYAPANYMAKNIGALAFSEETLQRFENLFRLINKKI